MVALGLAVACRPPAPPADPTPEADAGDELAPAVAPRPVILSAQLARIDDPELGGKDGLLLVFDVEIDAAALSPLAFIVTREGSSPARPEQAILAPASEDDENRTVLLVGELGDAEHPPIHVAVLGPLFAEDGRPLLGLGAAVLAFATAPRVVATEVLAAAPGRCEGAAQVLRTYWSTELRGVEPEDLERVRVQAGEAAPAAPLGFDDHATEHAEAGQDNVLDLCIGDTAPPRQLWIEAGALLDPPGHASAAVELRLGEPGA